MKRVVMIVGSVLAALVVGGYLSHDRALEAYVNDDEQFFKYGSIGSEPGGTLLHPIGGLLPPAPIFRALPRICPNVASRLGEVPERETWRWYQRAFGLIYDPDRRDASGTPSDLPLGLSRRKRLGGEMVGVNCALCHAGTVRTSPEAKPVVYAGMPPQQVDVQRLFRFLFDCVESSEFTAGNVIAQIGAVEGRPPKFLDAIRYRVLVPRIRGRVADLRAKIGVVTSERPTASGPGRLDTINPGKALELDWSLESIWEGHQNGELNGTADFPPAWNLAIRTEPGFRMHWDGNFGTLDEVLNSAALAVGAKPQTLEQFERVRNYLLDLKPPRYPYPIDPDLALAGKAVYMASCVECHGLLGTGETAGKVLEKRRMGQVTPNARPGTDSLRPPGPDTPLGADPFRLNAFTPLYASKLQVALNQNHGRSNFQFRAIQKTDGYANVPLDGVWARAPYLHNGSVPTLRDLLQREACRPWKFHRGSDIYDPVNVGFVSYAQALTPGESACPQTRPGPTFVEAPAEARLFVFDTSLPGNGNAGHRWGTDLPDEQKRELLEFLKTQ